ncbi:hypothetical protein CDAR_503361 [Caerostris darwini]|uniref:Uncharacterized protein n=1 Tax=Caerostris darwini TaxID=1538125 RepID=A0AAV4NZU2_9ARAC|nr:hypothetical protein CDAR_503361 [Caerostris darwini]
MHLAACSIVSYSSSCPILLLRLTDDALGSHIAPKLFGFSKRKESGIIQRREIFFLFRWLEFTLSINQVRNPFFNFLSENPHPNLFPTLNRPGAFFDGCGDSSAQGISSSLANDVQNESNRRTSLKVSFQEF